MPKSQEQSLETSRKAKGRILKSIQWLSADGALVIFHGKNTNQPEEFLAPGVFQVDLIVLYGEGANKCVEVTTPQYAPQTARRLARLPMPPGWTKEMHVWRPKDKRPLMERIGTAEWWEEDKDDGTKEDTPETV